MQVGLPVFYTGM